MKDWHWWLIFFTSTVLTVLALRNEIAMAIYLNGWY